MISRDSSNGNGLCQGVILFQIGCDHSKMYIIKGHDLSIGCKLDH